MRDQPGLVEDPQRERRCHHETEAPGEQHRDLVEPVRRRDEARGGDDRQRDGDPSQHVRAAMQREEDDGPHEVVLLLHRQRPEMDREILPVPHAALGDEIDGVTPDRGGEPRGIPSAVLAADAVGPAPDQQRDERRIEEIGRHQAQRASHHERDIGDRARGGRLHGQKRGDQEAAQHEEQVDADPARLESRNAGVHEHHADDRQRTQAVQRGPVRRVGRARRLHVRSTSAHHLRPSRLFFTSCSLRWIDRA
jgi:hypothetical protein